MEVKGLDDMAKSAISEIDSMVAGNSAIFFMNMSKNINITPSSLYAGNNRPSYTYKGKTFCVPMNIYSDY